jgi:hypothetical protein
VHQQNIYNELILGGGGGGVIFGVFLKTYGAQEWQEEILAAFKCKVNVGVDGSA